MSTFTSIIVCTQNRCQSLYNLLQILHNIHVPSGFNSELLIVDNGSTDGTADMIKAAKPYNPSIRYLFETRPGKSHAYNTAIAHAGGDILLFIDDDVHPPPDWIAQMCAPILQGRGEAVAGGVRLAPHLERPWMKPVHRQLLASTQHLHAQSSPTQLFGANMAISRAVLEKVPAFDTELGPGTALPCHEDSLFSWQLLRAGYTIIGAYDVIAEHHFDESRLRRTAFLDHAQREQRSWAYVRHHWKHEVVTAPVRHLLWYTLYLARMRASKPGEWLREEGCAEWEMTAVGGIAFYKQYLQERKRPPNYEKYGLVKKATAAFGNTRREHECCVS